MADERSSDLSWPTVIGGAAGAATAAALSTRLGLVGTVLGAGVASVVATVVATALAHWLARAHDVTRRRTPVPVRALLVTAGAIGLVAVASYGGLELLTRDLPHDTLAGRLLARLGG